MEASKMICIITQCCQIGLDTTLSENSKAMIRRTRNHDWETCGGAMGKSALLECAWKPVETLAAA